MAIHTDQRNREWLLLSSYPKVTHWSTVIGIGVRCKDGVAHIAELDLSEAPHKGSVHESRREVLRQIHEHIVKELAALELESS